MKTKLVLLSEPKNVYFARNWLIQNCRQYGIRSRKLLDVKTATSEIVTNVVKYAYRSGQKKNFIIITKFRSNTLTIIVRDYGSGIKASRKNHSLHLGLFIVKALANKVRIISFGLGTQVKLVFYFKESEIKKPKTTISKIHIIPHSHSKIKAA